MTDKEETRHPDRVAFEEEVPEFSVTRHELRRLARYWYDERLFKSYWFFIDQTTDGFEWRWSVYINCRLRRLSQVLGTEVMQELQDDAIARFRKRHPKITDEEWRVFREGTDQEQQAWRVKVFREEELAEQVMTVEEARGLHATFGTRQAND